jgi:DNA mismatch repair protein MLH1
MAQETSATQPRIQALPQQVIDRIAAGEVVQRPASVVKELIENSLDAQASNIDVQCTAGGMRLISVTDDGHGIHPQDLELAAKRFATSKLRKLDDLKEIQTFGFRGEALASASMVGRLEIVSRRRSNVRDVVTEADSAREMAFKKSKEISTLASRTATSTASSCAYKMTYRDGEPCGRAVPSAGKEGTAVKLQDLFYNVPNRRRAFEGARKEAEEYQRILNVVQKYAVDRARDGVGFVCRKKGGNTDLNTSSMSCIRNLQRQRQQERMQPQEQMRRVLDNADGCDSGHDDDDDDDEYCNLQEQCTRNVIGHLYGSDTCRELLTFQCEEGNVHDVSVAALKSAAYQVEAKGNNNHQGHNVVEGQATEIKLLQEGKMLEDCFKNANGYDYGAMIAKQTEFSKDKTSDQYSFAYKAYGLVTKGSYCVPKASSAFLLFINKRLVESSTLKRALESVYLDMLPKGAKPFIYLSLELPGPHLDVNVHPTKQEVAFLHEDRLCDALVIALRNLLRSSTTSRTFYTQTLLADQQCTIMKIGDRTSKVDENNHAESLNGNRNESGIANEDKSVKSRIKSNANTSPVGDTIRIHEKTDDPTEEIENYGEVEHDVTLAKKRKVYDPKNLVRTTIATEQGALVPFLVHTQKRIQPKEHEMKEHDATVSRIGTDASNLERTKELVATIVHTPDCEFSSECQKLDLSIPGAFAFLCRCQVKQVSNVSTLQKSNVASAPFVRPKKIVPTECSYISIETLRRDIQDRMHEELTTKLRESTFVGCISRYRCLLQSGIELLMVNHYELAKELFYQLSVLRFGGFRMAKLGTEGVDVKCLIQQALQFEDTLKSFASSSESHLPAETNLSQDDVNSELAKQAAKCLFDNAEMLEEYFSIKFILKNETQLDSGEGVLLLTGLPIILDGHSPSRQALPLFLLRLATEVDWSEEQPCFEGICTELGRYYAEIPLSKKTANKIGDNLELIDDEEKKFVQHTLFPALRYLLVPPTEFANDGSFLKLALLSKLYKVFERC